MGFRSVPEVKQVINEAGVAGIKIGAGPRGFPSMETRSLAENSIRKVGYQVGLGECPLPRVAFTLAKAKRARDWFQIIRNFLVQIKQSGQLNGEWIFLHFRLRNITNINPFRFPIFIHVLAKIGGYARLLGVFYFDCLIFKWKYRLKIRVLQNMIYNYLLK